MTELEARIGSVAANRESAAGVAAQVDVSRGARTTSAGWRVARALLLAAGVVAAASCGSGAELDTRSNGDAINDPPPKPDWPDNDAWQVEC